MTETKRRMLSVVLTLLMVVGLYTPVQAAEPTPVITIDGEASIVKNIKDVANGCVMVTDTATVAGKTFTYTANPTGVVKVEEGGSKTLVLTPLKYGTTTITVTSADGKSTATMTVNVYCSAMVIDDMTLDVGKNQVVTVKGPNGFSIDPSKIMFTSTDETVATVSGNKITGVKAGNAKIIATYVPANNFGNTENVIKEFTCKVIQPVLGIKTDKDSYAFNVKTSAQITAEITPADATDKTLTYESSNEEIVTVDKTGKMTGLKGGNAKITISASNGIKKVVNVTIIQPSGTIDVEEDAIELEVGKTSEIKATVLPEETTDKTITYKSSNEEIATVDKNGVITAVKAGSTVITLTCGEAKASVKVKAIQPAKEVKADEAYEMEQNEKVQIKATILPENTTDKTLVYVVKDETICSVDKNGLLTGLKPGETTVSIIAHNGVKVDVPVKINRISVKEIKTDKEEIKVAVDENAALTITLDAEASDLAVVKSLDESIARAKAEVVDKKTIKVTATGWHTGETEIEIVVNNLKKPISKKVKVTVTGTAEQPQVTKPTVNKVKTKLTAKKKALVVTITDTSKQKYEIQYSTSKKFKKTATKTVKTSKKKYTIKKLKAKKKYYVRVRSYATYKDENGNTQTVYSKWSSKVNKKTK